MVNSSETETHRFSSEIPSFPSETPSFSSQNPYFRWRLQAFYQRPQAFYQRPQAFLSIRNFEKLWVYNEISQDNDIVGCNENQSLWQIHFTYFDHINSRKGQGVGRSSIFFENYKKYRTFLFQPERSNKKRVLRKSFYFTESIELFLKNFKLLQFHFKNTHRHD